MSDSTLIFLILALFLAASITVGVLARLMYKRCDDILSGVVNGAPVSLKSRWLFFLHDYVALSFGITMVLGVTAVGFVSASEFVDDSNARALTYLCAGISGGFFFFNLLLGLIWMRHFTSVLRQAEAD
jgi:hypothetical protein